MDRRLKTILIVGGIAVAGYLIYRWYQNRQSSQQGEGSNLGSVGYMTSGGAGSDSGLNYYAGATTVNLTQPVTDTGAGPTYPLQGGNPPTQTGPITRGGGSVNTGGGPIPVTRGP